MKHFTHLSFSLLSVAALAGVAFAGPGDKTNPPATGDKNPPPAAATMPKAPDALVAAAKAMTGTWKCTGQAMDMASNKMAPTKATIKNKADLDGWWIVTSFAETKKGGYKFTELSSFDGTKWTRDMFDNMGGHETDTSTGMADNKMSWEGSSVSSMGTMKSRHTEEVKSAKEIHMSGEYSQDGKTYMQVYDLTCKK